MRYVTWKISWQPNVIEGYGPEEAISERGCKAEGILSLGPNAQNIILGYVHGECSLDGLNEWEIIEISGQDALSMAQTIDPETMMNAEGRLIFPIPNKNA